MAKRLTEKQKKELTQLFQIGRTIEALSEEFNCSKLTVIRNLKKELGDKIYKDSIKNNSKKKFSKDKIINDKNFESKFETGASNNDFVDNKSLEKKQFESNPFPVSEFIEISPLNYEIENVPRKELSSMPIDEIDLPNVVYMIVDKNIELEIKLLKEYPDWEFLPNEDLKRKTIEIFLDSKTAKRVSNKEQKVIKVPNPEVFRIVSPILISKGISRIVFDEKLIAL